MADDRRSRRHWRPKRSAVAALCHRACRPAPDGSIGPVGDTALTGGREGARLRDHHHNTERAVCGASPPNAGDLEIKRMAGLARGAAGGPAPTQGPPGTIPSRRNGGLACRSADRMTQPVTLRARVVLPLPFPLLGVRVRHWQSQPVALRLAALHWLVYLPSR